MYINAQGHSIFPEKGLKLKYKLLFPHPRKNNNQKTAKQNSTTLFNGLLSQTDIAEWDYV